MKQHITVEQLNELSEKGKERLRKWSNCGILYLDNFIVDGLPLLSIGHMLHFLYEAGAMGGTDDFGRLVIPVQELDTYYLKKKYKDTFICDNLWWSVKEVLEK